jgi:hypothetical protein
VGFIVDSDIREELNILHRQGVIKGHTTRRRCVANDPITITPKELKEEKRKRLEVHEQRIQTHMGEATLNT